MRFAPKVDPIGRSPEGFNAAGKWRATNAFRRGKRVVALARKDMDIDPSVRYTTAHLSPTILNYEMLLSVVGTISLAALRALVNVLLVDHSTLLMKTLQRSGSVCKNKDYTCERFVRVVQAGNFSQMIKGIFVGSPNCCNVIIVVLASVFVLLIHPN